jgi:hypothetical protein
VYGINEKIDRTNYSIYKLILLYIQQTHIMLKRPPRLRDVPSPIVKRTHLEAEETPLTISTNLLKTTHVVEPEHVTNVVVTTNTPSSTPAVSKDVHTELPSMLVPATTSTIEIQSKPIETQSKSNETPTQQSESIETQSNPPSMAEMVLKQNRQEQIISQGIPAVISTTPVIQNNNNNMNHSAMIGLAKATQAVVDELVRVVNNNSSSS